MCEGLDRSSLVDKLAGMTHRFSLNIIVRDRDPLPQQKLRGSQLPTWPPYYVVATSYRGSIPIASSRFPESARPIARMHRKSQSTSALSVILSAPGQPSTPSTLRSGCFLPSLSEGERETEQLTNTPSKRTETRSRISHSRTKSDLASLACSSRSRPQSPTPSRIRRKELPPTPRSSLGQDDEAQALRKQPTRRRETTSSTEVDTSDASDLDLGKLSRSRLVGKEVTVMQDRTPLRTSREDIRADQTRRTPRKDTSTPKKTPRDNELRGLTLDLCPSIVSTD